MNLRDLEYVVAVADARSFRQAAAAVGVSQPTLSTQVKKLENELGVTLFDRSVTPLALTPVGVSIVERARSVLRRVDEIRAVAAHDGPEDAGTLRLGLFPTLGPYLLPHVIDAVRDEFPEVRLVLVEEQSALLEARVLDGSLDAAFLALPVDAPGTCVRPLFTDELLLAVPQGHRLAVNGPLHPSDVASTEILCLAEGHCLGDQVSDWIAAHGGRRRDDFRASSLESLRTMVSAGSAATLLPALAVVPPALQASGVVIRRFAEDAPSRTIALVWRQSSPQAPLIAKIADAFVPHDIPDGLVTAA